ncbi:hypothetical protein AAVH_13003 [Aphelenchoides avenae]|nr:hypothetical protein AAVH_13003 [Aphelenchus avenae]
MTATILPTLFVALLGVLCDAADELNREWDDFREALLLQHTESLARTERLKSGSPFVDQRQAVIWNNRTYSFVSYANLPLVHHQPSLPASQFRERVPRDVLLFVHERPMFVAWSCRPSQACCGLQCCDINQRSKREWWHYERADRHKEFGYVIASEWAGFRNAVLLQTPVSSVGDERSKPGATFVDPRQAITWNHRLYSFISYTSLASVPESQCRERVPRDFLLFVHERPKFVTWSCQPSQVCCGLRCCDVKQRSKRDWWHYERADGRKEFGYVIVVVVVAVIVTLCLCSTANYDPRRRMMKERRERLAKRRQLHPHTKAVYAQQTQVLIEQVRLLDPPLPLSADVVHEHFEPCQNTDFRNENDFNKSFFRGGARYIRPISCYRYALAVAGRYPGGDEWIGNTNAEGEWQVAYHGTKFENVSGIIRNGFDIEKCQRFTVAGTKP